ncbi:MAG: DNA mismatch repair protein MutS [Oscillospiraceae bacterium]
MAEITPMMRQYLEIKEQNPDAILFFRLGDFYEMFNEDAEIASRELDLTLTTRDRGKAKEDQTPMCGVPYHSSEGYIARLIAKGYKVAICEQTEDPATAKGLVDRDVIRVVTPGTVIDSSMLEDSRSNFIAAVYLDERFGGVAFCDISTGKAHVTGFAGEDKLLHIMNELGRFAPREAVLSAGAAAEGELCRLLREKLSCRVETVGDKPFDALEAEKNIRRQFGEEAWRGLPRAVPAAAMALGGLLRYLYDTQKTDLSYIRELDCYTEGRFMELDLATRRNLELTETLRNKEKRGSLLWVLDQTRTAMGGRMLRSWLERPLRSVAAINRRSAAVEALTRDNVAREELSVALGGIGDMERQISRIVYGTAGGRDLAALRQAAEHLPRVKELLAPFETGLLREISQELDTLEDVQRRITETLVDEPPFSVREGDLIRDGYNAEVDRLRGILKGGKGFLAEMEAREKERTGIRTLKIGYNKVFGYYIEVSKSFADQVPEDYIRKQTLVGGERYITPELKEMENTIFTAGDRIASLEYELFSELRDFVAGQMERVQRSAAAVAEADALCSLAAVAVKQRYCRPTVDESGRIEIREGRHPVVEKTLKDALFIPNDTQMDEGEQRVAIITGPNMAGKSTYMRQVALIVLLAQIGSFVPAKSARIGVCDRIFTRIGASDDLAAGQSTFMVEMTEVSAILHAATKDSLLILDEIGRGTSTFDGMSIARAVVEYCADEKKLGAKTLFATHYHELTEMEHSLRGVKNYNIAVKARGEDIVFLRKILPGGADKSYGIEVAKLAGLPKDVVRRARDILRQLESGAPAASAPAAKTCEAAEESGQVSLGTLAEQEVAERLRRLQPDALTPIEALGLLYELKQKLQ